MTRPGKAHLELCVLAAVPFYRNRSGSCTRRSYFAVNLGLPCRSFCVKTVHNVLAWPGSMNRLLKGNWSSAALPACNKFPSRSGLFQAENDGAVVVPRPDLWKRTTKLFLTDLEGFAGIGYSAQLAIGFAAQCGPGAGLTRIAPALALLPSDARSCRVTACCPVPTAAAGRRGSSSADSHSR